MGENQRDPTTLGIVLFPGFEPLDVIGPVELFAQVEEITISFIGETAGPIKASCGNVELVAHVSFQEIVSGVSPAPKWVLIPGGRGTRSMSHALLDFIRYVAPRTGYCMTVCTGTAVLAAAGVLDGVRATTNKMVYDWVITHSDKVLWQREARWVADGKFVTSSGVSAGMDMAIYVIKTVFGADEAAEVAKYVEYMPSTNACADPFADKEFRPPV